MRKGVRIEGLSEMSMGESEQRIYIKAKAGVGKCWSGDSWGKYESIKLLKARVNI